MSGSQNTQQQIDCMARECVSLRLRLVNRVVTNLYDEALRPLGLKASQLNILVATSKLGLAEPARVCEILQLDASTVSRNVKRMRDRHWLEVVSATDGRAQPFRLTVAGQRLLEKAAPRWQQAQDKAAELLGTDGVRWLRTLSGKLAVK
jgi:DNA-binding MarR family transcriptional regulator